MGDDLSAARGAVYDWKMGPTPEGAKRLYRAWLEGAPEEVVRDYLRQHLPPEEVGALGVQTGAEGALRLRAARHVGPRRLEWIYAAPPFAESLLALSFAVKLRIEDTPARMMGEIMRLGGWALQVRRAPLLDDELEGALVVAHRRPWEPAASAPGARALLYLGAEEIDALRWVNMRTWGWLAAEALATADAYQTRGARAPWLHLAALLNAIPWTTIPADTPRPARLDVWLDDEEGEG